jgi:hypothetical protein
MSGNRLDYQDECNEMLRRRAEIQASGKPPAPLKAQWQKDLRAIVTNLAGTRERKGPPADHITLLLIAELLRWLRDEAGYSTEWAAELAVGYAEVFGYGGEDLPEHAAAAEGGVQ